MTKSRKYLWYLIGTLILVLTGLIFDTEFEIDLHNSNIGFRLITLTVTVSFFLFLSGIGYYLFRNKATIGILDNLHHLTTCLGILTIFIAAFLYSNIDFDSAKSFEEFALNGQYTAYCFYGILGGLFTILTGFVFYLVNLTLTGFRK
jgi:hypothetical protein